VILGIDPGLRAIGWATVEDDGTLFACGLARGALSGRGPDAWGTVVLEAKVQIVQTGAPALAGLGGLRVVCEFPQVYAPGKGKGDPADLLELAAIVGALSEALGRGGFRTVLPRAWKGNVPKEIMTDRILASLSATDSTVYVTGTARVPVYLRHNVLDAIGIAKWAAKRAGR
jgi:hypothetical protein